MQIAGLKGIYLFTSNASLIFLAYPLKMINAFIAEYRLWSFAPFFGVIMFIFLLITNKTYLSNIQKLIVLGLGILIAVYPFSPVSYQEWIMVSSIRYTYVPLTLLTAAIFMFTVRIKKESMLSYFAVGNMILFNSFAYYPKLIFIYLPLAFILFMLFDKKLNIQRFKNLIKV